MDKTTALTLNSKSGWSPPKLICLTALLIVVGLILWLAADVILLIFMGVLIAILLSFASEYVSRHTPLNYGWSLATVLVSLVIMAGLILGTAGARIAAETDNLIGNLQDSWSKLKEQASHYDWAKQLVPQVETLSMSNIPDGWLGQMTGVFGATIGAASSILLVAFVSIFLAADPGLYQRGLVLFAPIHYRARVNEILKELGEKLRWWFVGQLFSMTVVGVSTAIGLWLLGIPFFVTLGILAGLLTFIPNFGPIISAVPAILLGLVSGFWSAFYVALLYMGVQAVESNFLTPLIQQRNVRLPPVLGVGTQVLMGVLAGLPGLITAAPLAVLVKVLAKRLYIEDTLGDRLE